MDCRLVLLAVVLCIFDVALSQDRSRSRYIPSNEDDGEIYRAEKVQEPAVRQTSSRRRQSSSRTQDDSSSSDSGRAPAQSTRGVGDRLPDPQLKDTYDVRQPSDGRRSYHDSVGATPSDIEDPPVDNGQRRRKRPKKRRRPKQEAKPEISEIEPSRKLPEDRLSPTPSTSAIDDDYHAYRKPSTLPEENMPQRGRPRHDNAPLVDTRGQRQTRPSEVSSRLPDSRTARRQSHSQATANRLPLTEAEPPRVSRNKPAIPEAPTNVREPYRKETSDTGISGGYETNYAPDEESDVSRLPAGVNQAGFLGHSAPIQPLGDPAFSHRGTGYDDLSNRPINSEPIDKVAGQEPSHSYPPTTNRLLSSPEVPYIPNVDPADRLPSSAVDNIDYETASGRDPAQQSSSESSSSDRLPNDEFLRSLPVHSSPHDRLPRPESRSNVPDRVQARAPSSTRTGSRYQSAEVEPARVQTPGEQQRRQVPSRTSSRYPGASASSDEASDRGSQRSSARTQRTGSRYQPEDQEYTRTTPSRTPQRYTEPPASRSVSTPQRTRSRYEDPNRSTTQRDQPEPTRPSRTRSRYQPETVSSPDDSYSGPVEEPERLRTGSRRDRTRTQSDYQQPAAPVTRGEAARNDGQFHRSRGQYEPEARGPQSAAEVGPVPDQYAPQYQSAPRSPQRRPEVSPPANPAANDVSSRQRRPSSRKPQEDAPRGQQAPPRSNTNFECPDPYGFYPDENQCDKYYECRNDTAEEGLCPDGLAFNPISAPTYLRCDSVRDIDCSSRPKLQTPQPTKNCPRRFGLFPDEKECTKFWHCVDGTSTQVTCPPGLVYDDSKGTCNWADLVKDSCSTEDLLGFTCPEAKQADLQEGVYLRYPHPDNCQLHFTCITGTDGTRKPRMLSCNEGFVFDPETGQCTRPENVPGCEEFYGPPPPRRSTTRKPARELPPPEDSIEDEPPLRSQRRRRPTQSNQRTRS